MRPITWCAGSARRSGASLGAPRPSWFCPDGKPDEGEYSQAENDNCNRGHFEVENPSWVKWHAPCSWRQSSGGIDLDHVRRPVTTSRFLPVLIIRPGSAGRDGHAPAPIPALAAVSQRLAHPLVLQTLGLYFKRLDDDASLFFRLPQRCRNNSRLDRAPFGWGCRNGAYIAEAATISVGLCVGGPRR